MKLVPPSLQFKDSFLEAAVAIAAEGNDNFLKWDAADNDFESYLKSLSDNERGIGLPEGFVPVTTLWLIDNDQFIGRVGIRHYLNDELFRIGGHIGYITAPKYRGKGYGQKILALNLPEAKKLGIEKALVTCDVSNTASAKIIERSGGVFENELFIDEHRERKRRYWITL